MISSEKLSFSWWCCSYLFLKTVREWVFSFWCNTKAIQLVVIPRGFWSKHVGFTRQQRCLKQACISSGVDEQTKETPNWNLKLINSKSKDKDITEGGNTVRAPAIPFISSLQSLNISGLLCCCCQDCKSMSSFMEILDLQDFSVNVMKNLDITGQFNALAKTRWHLRYSMICP